MKCWNILTFLKKVSKNRKTFFILILLFLLKSNLKIKFLYNNKDEIQFKFN